MIADELPAYLAEEPGRLPKATISEVPMIIDLPPLLPDGFFRVIDLPGAGIAHALAHTTTAGRLVFDPPNSTRPPWRLTGEVRRTGRHGVPVIVELWPVHDRWTALTMTPRRSVRRGRRWFRAGQRALDELSDELVLVSTPGGTLT